MVRPRLGSRLLLSAVHANQALPHAHGATTAGMIPDAFYLSGFVYEHGAREGIG